MSQRFLDRYYSPQDVALSLGVEVKWVYRRLPGKSGQAPAILWRDGSVYWPNATDIGSGDWRIPAGDLNRRLEEGKPGAECAESAAGILARSRGELLRKVNGERGRDLQTCGEGRGF